MEPETRGVAIRGLEGVIAAETRIGYVDGANGKLYYAGYDINDLAKHASYEECVYLLWNDRLPTKRELEDFRAELIPEMTLPRPLVQWFKRVPRGVHPMVMLRSAVSDLALYDKETEDNSVEANRRKAARLVAKVPSIIAGFHRIYNGHEVVPPDPKKSIAVNFLRMFTGKEPDKKSREAIELMFVLHADHGFNASTFAARVTASTLADIYAAITAAIGALKGPLHGGANVEVLTMLEQIHGGNMTPDEYVRLAKDKDSKVRLMGFGHRVYKNFDPRAQMLQKVAEELVPQLCGNDPLLDIARRLEEIARSDPYFIERNLYPNVDFYSGILLRAIGIPTNMFTVIFAIGRLPGWIAQWWEQNQAPTSRIARPRQIYTGRTEAHYIPMEQRD